MKNIITMSASIIACVFLGCAAEERLDVAYHGEDGMSGSYVYEGIQVDYEVRSADENRSQVKVLVDENPLELDIDMASESLVMDGYGVILTEEQKQALKLLVANLSQYFAQRNGEFTMHDYAMIRIIDYWSDAPAGFEFGRVVYGPMDAVQDGLLRGISANEGITCIRKGTWVTAKYDDSKGDHSESVLVGSTARAGYECMGRCGAGCGSSSIPSSWCKDCLDHDQCSHKNNSSGGSSDKNCGDEYNEAADDWMFGVVRGCNGK
jgi:hypothetical protein